MFVKVSRIQAANAHTGQHDIDGHGVLRYSGAVLESDLHHTLLVRRLQALSPTALELRLGVVPDRPRAPLIGGTQLVGVVVRLV